MGDATDITGGVAEHARLEADAYRGDSPRPLEGYTVVLGSDGLPVTLTAAIAAATGRKLLERGGIQDLVTVTVGTHKLSRTLSKDAVTSPPFAHYAGSGGPAEVMQETRHGSALRHSIGELLTCHFCLGRWVATASVIALTFTPGLTRSIAGTFTALAGADFLQLAYGRAQQMTEG